MTRAIDAGWLFLAAGLAVCAAAVILPAQRELEALERQVRELEHEQVRLAARVDAYRTFLDAMGRNDRDLVRRLAAIQLNAMPEDEVPLLVTRDDSASVVRWIESTAVGAPDGPPSPRPASTLERLVLGRTRLWMIAGGALSVFLGIILTPALSARRRDERTPSRRRRFERPRPGDERLAAPRPCAAAGIVAARPHRPAWPLEDADAPAYDDELDAVEVAEETTDAAEAFDVGDQLELGFASAAETVARLREPRRLEEDLDDTDDDEGIDAAANDIAEDDAWEDDEPDEEDLDDDDGDEEEEEEDEEWDDDEDEEWDDEDDDDEDEDEDDEEDDPDDDGDTDADDDEYEDDDEEDDEEEEDDEDWDEDDDDEWDDDEDEDEDDDRG